MKIGIVALAVICAASAAIAGAQPRLSLRDLARTADLQDTGFLNQPDKRAPLFKSGVAERARLRGNEKALIANSVAYLQCGSDGKKAVSHLTRFGMSGNSVVFVVHRVDADGRPRPDGGLKPPCVARGQRASAFGSVVDGAEVDLGTLRFLSAGTSKELRGHAIVLAKLKLPGKRLPPGLPVDGTGRVVPFEIDFSVVSAVGLNKGEKGWLIDPRSEPLIQTCRRPYVKELGPWEAAEASRAILSDCTSTHGQTGSIGLSRLNDRALTLAVKSLLLSGTLPQFDDEDFDVGKGNYTLHTAITTEVAEQMMAFDKQ